MRHGPQGPTAGGQVESHRGRLVAAVVILAVCVSCLPAVSGCRPKKKPSSAIPLAGKVQPPSEGAYLGVYVPPAPFDPAEVGAFEKQAEKDVAIVMWYQPWARNNRYLFDPGACYEMYRQGKVPMITWEPWDPGKNANALRDPGVQPAYRLSTIVDGTYDGYIRKWARSIKGIGGPVMLRPMHEMNGNWYPWCGTANGNKPAEFVAAWRHMHDIFEQEGATNVTWVWSINHQSVPGVKANEYPDYYPGDDYVDWTAISGFNWGTSMPRTKWAPFSRWYTPPLTYLVTLDKPICIAEFGSVEQGGDKAAWLTDAYERIEGYPDVKAVLYYDAIEYARGGTQDWRIGTSPASSDAFREAISTPYYVSTPPAALTDWWGSLTRANMEKLRSFRSVY